MPYRLFEDSKGNEWQVWDIVPRLTEQRNGAQTDRRVDIIPIAFADRRMKGRRQETARRARLRGSFARGWLCFVSDNEKRRLSPIPADWTTCDEATLEAYASEGETVPPLGRPSYSDEPFAAAG